MLSSKNSQAVLIALLAAAAVVGIIILMFGADRKTNDENLEFIRSYGWQAEERPEEITRLTIPAEFDPVLSAYNGIQQSSGLDLAPYRGVKAVRYSYRILNHAESDSGLIRANLFVTKEGIVAADLCSLKLGGFIQPISSADGQVNE